MPFPHRIHVTGGSGSGTTTLGRAIAERHGHIHLDTDDFFWEPSDPPFTVQRSRETRLRLLREAMTSADRWVLSGAIDPWGYELTSSFDLVVWLTVPPEARLRRLRDRESADYGIRIVRGGDMHDGFEEFMRWAASYDTADTSTRSYARHAEWAASLSRPVIRVDGERGAEHATLREHRACIRRKSPSQWISCNTECLEGPA